MSIKPPDFNISVEPSAGYLSDVFRIRVMGVPIGERVTIRAVLAWGTTYPRYDLFTYVEDTGAGVVFSTNGRRIVESMQGVRMTEDRHFKIYAQYSTEFTPPHALVTIYAARMNMTPEQAKKCLDDGGTPFIRCTLPILSLLPWVLYIPGIPILPGFAIAEKP